MIFDEVAKNLGELVQTSTVELLRERYNFHIKYNKEDEDATELSIQDNLKRPNLEWWERAILERQLHDLRQSQHGRKKSGPGREGWSLRDTADEIGMSFGTLSEDLRLADAVMANPNLRKIEDKTTAKRLIFGMAKRAEAEAVASMPTKIETNVVLCGNSAEILKWYPDNSFDACITDPPWIEYKDKELTRDDQTLLVFKEIYRVLKVESFLYAFVSTPDFDFYKVELPKIGFQVQTNPLIWHKLNIISHGLRSWEYMRDFEPIILAVKGNPHLTQSTAPSAIFTYPILHSSKSIHPNEKPVELISKIMDQCSYEGSIILDPFGGSGVTGEAAIKGGKRYVIIEKEHRFYRNIESRLKVVE